MRYTTASTGCSRAGSSAPCGTRYGIPASRIFALARTRRWAMVVSGTRKAWAISAVVSPPSSRSVRATCTFVARAGWQHVKISRSLSSSTVPSLESSAITWSSGVNGAGERAACSSAALRCLSPRPASRRSRSTARFRAVVMIQPAGLGGMPETASRRTARVKASWTASSAASMSPSTRVRTATARPYSCRKTPAMSASGLPATGSGVGTPDMVARTIPGVPSAGWVALRWEGWWRGPACRPSRGRRRGRPPR